MVDEANIKRALHGQPPLIGAQTVLGKRYAIDNGGVKE
jgi:hypothetical protein